MRIIPEDRLQTSRDENEKCKATNEGEDGTVRILARLMCLIQHVLDGGDRKETGSEGERSEFHGIRRSAQEQVGQKCCPDAVQDEGSGEHDPALSWHAVLA